MRSYLILLLLLLLNIILVNCNVNEREITNELQLISANAGCTFCSLLTDELLKIAEASSTKQDFIDQFDETCKYVNPDGQLGPFCYGRNLMIELIYDNKLDSYSICSEALVCTVNYYNDDDGNKIMLLPQSTQFNITNIFTGCSICKTLGKLMIDGAEGVAITAVCSITAIAAPICIAIANFLKLIIDNHFDSAKFLCTLIHFCTNN